MANPYEAKALALLDATTSDNSEALAWATLAATYEQRTANMLTALHYSDPQARETLLGEIAPRLHTTT